MNLREWLNVDRSYEDLAYRVTIQDPGHENPPVQVVVGEVNTQGGLCSCCAEYGSWEVISVAESTGWKEL